MLGSVVLVFIRDLFNWLYIPMKLDLADSNAWILKASYWTGVWARHNSFFKCKTSLFAFKVFSNVAYSSLVATSKPCCNVAIVCTYVLETHKWFSRPCRKDYHGRDFDCNLVPTKQGCERGVPKMKPWHPWEGTLHGSHKNWNPVECPFLVCHRLKYL